ncbi:efflux RND transporter periplasmic adaptor subunit [Luteimonas sp. MC1825]|uniref:efflux RND transporter periplasmic adaptor subunit n=1 Tax=Luteimonas sp. MC1825 TaxID=2761107 RepID=UPI001617BD26|nr:efflux RND transporter periplasmic adaptor subunit [Luteimonas sp. MC1825]MBB6598470.1 efflux RND transporter periplasmic adaptor subunit [Luteimonas sp. MC1825]QOC88663.1 efflux RND transporter periplasmic adaptor subunit [Luteimonas sp. MC1825]
MPRSPVSGLFPRCWLPAALALALAACGGKDAPAARAEAAVTVTTATVAIRPFNDRIRALATVNARESVDVTAKVSETVDRVHFESGDEVAAGAPLVTLSGQQQDAALAAARATANEADRLYRRQQELAAQQLIARASLDTQGATRDSARAQVRQIEANLRDRVIRAPFAGVLGIRQVSPGALVTPGTVIATLDDIARVHVDFPVPEAQLAHVAAGQRVAGTSGAWPGRSFEGTVSIVDSRVDAATRAVIVRADFANAERLLRPGMLLQVELERPARDALLVPEIAIVQVGRDSFVYRVKADDTVEQVIVAVGARDAGNAEVTSGLAVGDRIVVDGTGKLRPGLAIREAAPASVAPAPAAEPAGSIDPVDSATVAPAGT